MARVGQGLCKSHKIFDAPWRLESIVGRKDVFTRFGLIFPLLVDRELWLILSHPQKKEGRLHGGHW